MCRPTLQGSIMNSPGCNPGKGCHPVNQVKANQPNGLIIPSLNKINLLIRYVPPDPAGVDCE